MASIYRPTYRDPKTGARKKSRVWRIAYLNEHGQRVTIGGFRDKEATKAKAKQLERDAERARAGLPLADEQRRLQPIAELTDLWIAEMKRLGRSPRHIKEQNRLLTRLWSECGWKCLAQIRVDRLNLFLAALHDQDRGSRTLNSYRDALHTFLGFCKGQRWIEENPLTGHPKARSGGRKKKPRRAYTADEFTKLCAASLHHRSIYLVAGLSGLRRSELRQLEKRDLTPTGDRPTWHLRAEITKGRRKDVVPMIPDVVPIIRPLWEQLPSPTSRLFARIPRTRTLHKDFQRAKVERLDAEGRCLDFHSLRYFFCTLCARHLPIQVVRLLMRHKDIRQTVNLYMDLGLTDVSEAVMQLPQLLPPA